MDKAKAINDSWGLPPLRSLNDFLLESQRFQLPNFTDFEKWGNRVVNNLIYYQTNYLYMSITIILLVGSMNPSKMFLGLLAMAVVWGLCLFVFAENEGMIHQVKRQYPQLQIIFLVICACFVVYTINSILLLLFSLLLSFGVTFIHASLRLRNLKNKLVNKIEGMGLERTPMGAFLKYFEESTGIFLRTQTTLTQSLQ
ncbi:PRA1 family protein 3 [Hylaeus anthracinus]|uniref:PRA1 family protein 3 n=1 Tax=Hylaeus volcanicus TaxID=313075 RepID=UPI0023B800D5|nr:PRA1 family protein 3 [Hylaeus volcanicus]XP_054000094.1 PRA1 family protein 3 [Hylaeus anthracinus]